MKYKVGDIVKVRSDLQEGHTYGKDVTVKDMMKYLGQYVTIDLIAYEKYKIKEDSHACYWTDEMFEEESYNNIISKTISWLGKHYTDGTYMKVFDCECPLNVLVTLYSTSDIIQRVQKYEEENNGEV